MCYKQRFGWEGCGVCRTDWEEVEAEAQALRWLLQWIRERMEMAPPRYEDAAASSRQR